MDSEKRIRELEWEVEQLKHDLIHDPLTGLKTRNFFTDEGNKYLHAIAEESGNTTRKERFGFKTLSVLFIDIDFFKKVNDTHGHAAGDEVLRKVSQTVKNCVRSADTVARWGGEEITVLLLGADEEAAKNKADEIREAVQNLTFNNTPDLKVTVSAGVATSIKNINLAGLVSRADEALYKAKNEGRNKVVKYTEANGDKR